MNIFLILAHPEPKSFNGALFNVAQKTLSNQNHTVVTSDLYAMKFHAISDRTNFTSVYDADYLKTQLEEEHATKVQGFARDIETELVKLERCDLMIWQFPLWWFSTPAILKGWCDRVFAMGRIYGSGRVFENGVLKGKRAMLSFTTGSTEDGYTKEHPQGLIRDALFPIHGSLKYVGFDILEPNIVYAPVRKSQEEREKLLQDYTNRLNKIEHEPAIAI